MQQVLKSQLKHFAVKFPHIQELQVKKKTAILRAVTRTHDFTVSFHLILQ